MEWLLDEKGRILGSEGLIDRGQFEYPNSPRRGVASDQDRSILLSAGQVSDLFVTPPIVDKGRE